MDTAITDNKTQTGIKQLQRDLSSNFRKFQSILPNHITPEKFLRTIVTAVQSNKKLLDCTPDSLMKAAISCAKDGLLPDGREAAFVPFLDDRKLEAQYIPMYQGLLKRIRNSGLIFSIDAQIVYENDDFKWTQGTHPEIEHKPFFPGNRGKIIGVYAVAFYKGTDEKQFIVLEKGEIDKVRDSRKYKKVWNEYYEAMALKTALRRLAKFLPMDADIFDNDENTPVHESTIFYADQTPADTVTLSNEVGKSDKLESFDKNVTVEPNDQGVLDHAL